MFSLMKKPLLKFLGWFIWISISLLSQHVFATMVNIDPTFDTRIPIWFNDYVQSVAIQPDWKNIIGGSFTTYKWVSANRIIRLNKDGSIDTTFNIGSGFNIGSVTTITIQADGKVLVGGYLNTYQGFNINYLVRLNSDGSRDTSFDIGDGFNADTQAIVIQKDGKILVGGEFTTYKWDTANHLIRLNSNGSRDDSFDIGNGFDGNNAIVRSISILWNEKIVVGGEFTTYKWVSANRIIRLNSNGSRDNSFDIGDGFIGAVRSIKTQAGGKLIVGGEFSSYQGVSANRIIRLNKDGSRDNSFDIGNGFGGYSWTDGSVNTIAIQNDGKILVGWYFVYYQGNSVERLVRLNSDGSIDNSFTSLSSVFQSWDPTSIAIESDGKIVVGGYFYKFGGTNYIITLNSDGSRDSSFNAGNGFDNSILAVAVQTDGKVLLGGSFSSYNWKSANHLIRLNKDGSIDSSFNIGNGFDSDVTLIVIQNDGKILVGGSFYSYQGEANSYLIRLNSDGSRDTTFNHKLNSRTLSVAIQADGKLIVGGSFDYAWGVPLHYLIRLNTDGSKDDTFNIGSGFDQEVESVILQNDGKILVGGFFTTYQWATANHLIRLNSDGSRDNSFGMWGFSSPGAFVNTMVKQSNGKILVGGRFPNSIIRLNSDGTIDNSFNPGAGFADDSSSRPLPQSIVVDGTGKIIVAGSFTNYQGVSANHLIRLNSDGSRDNSFDIGNGFWARSRAAAIDGSGNILIWWDFTIYKEWVAGYIVKLYWANESNTVIIPDTTNATTVEGEFTVKWYTKEGGDLVWSNAISLSLVDGNIPVDLNLKSENIGLTLPANTQFKDKTDNTNYNGIINVPVINTSIDSIFDRDVLSMFNVGSTSKSTILEGALATINVPITGKSAWDPVYIYFSENNGASWYPKTIASVQGPDGSTYVSFKTDQLTEFSILDGTGMLLINNNNITTTSDSVILSTPATGVQNMRFSNDGVTWSDRETFSTTKQWTLLNGFWTKTVYAQFDIDGDSVSDVNTNDTIIYSENDTTAPVISLSGNSTITINSWSSYTDAGATASDNLDGDISANIVTSGSVDTSTTGTYIITYTVSDAAGNIATPVTRTVTVVVASTNGGSNGWSNGGGGGSSSPRSSDSSDILVPSVIDGVGEILHGAASASGSIVNSIYSTELNNAYLRAFDYDITTMDTIQSANIDGKLIRKDMAKMVSNFAVNVLKKVPSTGTKCTFSDTKGLTEEAKSFAILSCKLGLMGFESDGITVKKHFDPMDQVDRAQFGTILSRLLRAGKYNGGNPYYAKHLNALKAAGIMTKIDTPLQKEIRGYVMLMMMRATSK